MSALPEFQVRPRVGRNAIILIVLCGVFTIGGLSMIFSGEEVLAGLFGTAFFGGAGLYTIPKYLRRDVSMVLSAAGLEQRHPQGNAFIPWSDVEEIGIVSIFANKMVGLRLSSYDRYLNGMSPELVSFMAKSLPFFKLAARATSLLDVPTAMTLWSKLEGSDPEGALRRFGKVGDVAEALMWAREHYGYEVTVAWSDRDRPAAEFVALLKKYRSAKAA